MPDPVTGLIAGGATLIGSSMQSRSAEKAASSAAGAQERAAEAGIEEQRRQFDEIRKLLQPYVEAGTPALQAQQAILGLRSPAEQQAQIRAVEKSPIFQERVRQGEEALLQRASATGGLRGGNVQAALAQFRPALLAEELETRYGRLGGMTALGQRSAVGVGEAGMQTGRDVSGLLATQGAARAGGALAGGTSPFGQFLSAAPSLLGGYYGLTGQSPFSGFASPASGGAALGSGISLGGGMGLTAPAGGGLTVGNPYSLLQ
jgi:hypothetical protein